MNYKFSDLVDVKGVQRLTDLFYKATGMVSAVVDLEGVVLTGSGWQPLCTDFHRVNPETKKRCTESDTVIANQTAGQHYTVYKCKNGLVDAATPITIAGKHIANFFTGQFLFEPPDMEYFREQARCFGFDEAPYLEAVTRIPIMEEAKLQPFLEYFSEFAAMLGELGLKQLKQMEAASALRLYETIASNTRDIILFMRRDDGRILEANAAAVRVYGYSREELLSLTIHDLRAAELQAEIIRQMAEADDVGVLFETKHRRKDGTVFPVEVSSRGETLAGERTLISVVRDITDRKAAEGALRESEERWATTLSSIGDAVMATDSGGRISFINPVAEKLTGWALEDAVMKPVTEVFNIVNEQTRKRVDNPVARVLREGMIVGLANHTILIRRDGTEVPIDDSGAPVKDRDGDITGAVLVFRDITERKAAEEKILRAKEEWERTFDTVPDLIAIIDSQHRTLRVNEAMARRLGRKTEECVGLLCYEAVHGLSEPPDFCPHSKTLEDGLQHVEEVCESRLGGDFLVSTTPLRDARGHMIGTVHVAHDITERKVAEEALRRSEEQYRLLFAANPNPMFVFDEETSRFLAVNDAAVHHYGWPREEFLAMTVLDIRPVEDLIATRDIIRRHQGAHEAAIGIHRHSRKDGTLMDMEIAVSSILFGGRPARLCSMNDVTERRRAEEALRASEEKLRRFYESGLLGVIYWSMNGSLTDANDKFLEMTGYTRQEMEAGRIDWLSMTPEEYHSLDEQSMSELKSTGANRVPLEKEYVRKDGTRMPVLVAGAMLDEARFNGVAFVLDVSERKAREARIARLTQLYVTLSEVNEAIVRARDEGHLYEDVCRIIAGEGAFPLVWIGEAKGRELVPVASCGPAADYLGNIRIEMDGVLGQGPSGTCLREDRPVVNDDFDTNPATLPWREAARRHGFRASACFPLHRHGKPVGVLTIYSPQPHDFDSEQVDLLQALSADVSYALDTMEQEKLRTRAEAGLQRSLKRFELLAHTAEELLQTSDPQKLIDSLCRDVMEHLDCHVFFNFLVVEGADKLRLNAYAGIPGEEARRIEWLDFEVAVCGCAAQGACRIVAEHIPATPDPRTELVKSYGVKAYACHPLLRSEGSVIGTLSFGTRDRETFSEEDLSLMKAMADQVSVAMIRMRDEEAIRKSRDELEERVKERTEALRRQAELLELAHSAILVRDMESRITFWNARAEEVYGWTTSEALGEVTHSFLKTRFPVSYERYMTELLEEGRWEGELIHETKGGRDITVLSRHALQRGDDGNPVAIMEINLDVTEAKRTEQQLRQAQKLEALGTLSGGIAHDFNNLLAAIIGFTELVKDHLPAESKDRKHAARVLEAGMRGRELVRQMLTFSRRTEEERRPLRLSSVVKESVRLLRASIPSTISIRVGAESESGLILGDPVQIQQIVMNLAMNAAFAMREQGGALDIGLSDFSVSPSSGNPHGIAPGLYMKLTVRDMGVGIPSEIVDKIFDPFFTTKKIGEGTGLGLSVVLGIVRQSHGYITVKSEPDKGSTFEVYFPKVKEESTAEAPVRDEAIPAGTERVLFVDDEEALVEMGEELLAGLGYEVTCCTSSREALALYRLDPSRFDLVVTDQTMPDMTGIQLATEILSIRPVPVILCTGFSHTANDESARAAGIKGFVMKPLTKREIAETVRRALDER